MISELPQLKLRTPYNTTIWPHMYIEDHIGMWNQAISEWMMSEKAQAHWTEQPPRTDRGS